jgi:uncharacterized protein DUF29
VGTLPDGEQHQHAFGIGAETRRDGPPPPRRVDELGVVAGHEAGHEPEPAHALPPLRRVRRERVRAPAAAEDGLGDEPHVAQRDAEPLARGRVVVPRGVADQHHARREGGVVPRVLVRVAVVGFGRARLRQGVAERQRGHVEGVQQVARRVLAAVPPAVFQPVAEVEASSAPALREYVERGAPVHVHGLLVVGPALGALDQQPADDVVGRVGVDAGADPPRHVRAAPVGAHHEPRGGLAPAAPEFEADPRCGPGGDGQAGHAAQQPRPGGLRRRVQRLAQGGVPDVHGAGHARHGRGELDAAGLRRIRLDAFRVGHVAPRPMAARGGQHVEQAEAPGLLHAPGGHPLAAHPVPVDGQPLQHEHVQPAARERAGEGAARHPPAAGWDASEPRRGAGGTRPRAPRAAATAGGGRMADNDEGPVPSGRRGTQMGAGRRSAMREGLRGVDVDIVVWAERQAGALRRLAERQPDAGVDWTRVVEAVEGAGRSLLHEAEAETVRAFYWHLMLAAHPDAANRREWRAAAERGRRASRAHLGTGAAPRIDLRRLYARAVREVRLLGRIGAAGPAPLAGECPITLDEWTGEDPDTEALLRRLRA